MTSKVAWNSTTPAQRLGLNNGSTAVARSHALLPASKNLTGEGVSTGAADRRPAVKIEYYVPDWNKAATPATTTLEERETVVPAVGTMAATTSMGAWVSYEDLETRYAVSDPAVASNGAALTPEAIRPTAMCSAT